ncbi:MAG: hypothetical protein U0K19_04590 [Bifidobacteriaceae bacterium]|nr:hypothetical protein [Bifidobacteriaceae bacterium]
MSVRRTRVELLLATTFLAPLITSNETPIVTTVPPAISANLISLAFFTVGLLKSGFPSGYPSSSSSAT